MDDFSTPGKINRFGIHPSPANFIRPRKMPLSSMCPTILLDNRRNVEMILGSAGGSRISSAIAYVRLYFFVFFYMKTNEIFLGTLEVVIFQRFS